MPKKIKDLAIRTGTYTDRNGKEKGRYQNVGSILQMDDGGKILLLNRWFNPAGVPFAPGRENSDVVMISMFEPRDNNGNGGGQSDDRPAPQSKQSDNGPNDDIPF